MRVDGFTVEGTARDDGRSVVVSVTETRGRISIDGDQLVAAAVDADAAEKRQILLTPTGPSVTVSLGDPYSLLVGAAARLRPGYTLAGDVPKPSVAVPSTRDGVE